MPAGQGIVELDEDNCLLTSVTDDAGTDLGEQAEYGSFPKTSDDGSVGMIEIESRLRPAADGDRDPGRGHAGVLGVARLEADQDRPT